jgi:hypothetical protein
MAKTARQAIVYKGEIDEPVAFPVKTGETIYQGTFVAIGKDGYLYDLDSTACPEAVCVGIVADDSANATGEAATTSSGSISGTWENISANAGDKTVRRVYLHGVFEMTFTSITQAMVGTTMFATDNYTIDDVSSGTACVKVGTLLQYISATKGWLDLNAYYQGDGIRIIKGALSATTGGGAIFNVANPTGKTCLVEDIVIDITTPSTGAITIDAGIAATGTSNDKILDGAALNGIRVLSNTGNHGTNGGKGKWQSSTFVTGTASATGIGSLVGKYAIIYRIWS